MEPDLDSWIPFEAVLDVVHKVTQHVEQYPGSFPVEADLDHDTDTGDLTVYISFPGTTLCAMLHGTEDISRAQVEFCRDLLHWVAEKTCAGEFLSFRPH